MPNKNYVRGVRFERERLKHYKEIGYMALRTAGSHGTFDLVVLDSAHGVVTFIQCKTVPDVSNAKRILGAWKEKPPFPPMANIHQTLEVKVTGSTEVHSATV